MAVVILHETRRSYMHSGGSIAFYYNYINIQESSEFLLSLILQVVRSKISTKRTLLG